jgi:YgiT-type zinc finger domain-containing protein
MGRFEIGSIIENIGKMDKGTSKFHIDRKTYHLTFDQIPAWVCNQCGEAYFEESEVNKIQEIIQTIEIKTKEMLNAA